MISSWPTGPPARAFLEIRPNCESLYAGPQALRSMSEAERAELSAILPEVIRQQSDLPACRPMAPGRRARRLAYRHRKNNMPLTGEILLDAVRPCI